MDELTHASFFSGVGGLDLGLERAGWRTVSFSEIDPYASAVLAHRWPGVLNLGSIVDVATSIRQVQQRDERRGVDPAEQLRRRVQSRDGVWQYASLWTGGFPCQDLSVAGKRRGMGTHADRLDTRSGLAYAFLDLVERYRPPAILLENVPGLLSSNAGKDFGALLGRLGELGYGWAYRVLDAQHFGVPQRRRRVFICALRRGGHPDPDGAAAVLAVGTRCDRDHAAEREAWARAAGRAGGGPAHPFAVRGRHGGAVAEPDADGLSPAVRTPGGGSSHTHIVNAVVRPSPDPRGDGAPDGLAPRLDDRAGVAWAKIARPRGPDGDGERWGSVDVTPTVNGFDVGDVRAVTLVEGPPADGPDDPLLPLGLDSHRYRCCGNGVVAPVAEWIGERLARWAATS